MLRACVLDFEGSWDVHLPLLECSYNNNYHSSVRCASLEALYGRKCRSPIMWTEIEEGQLIGPELVQETTEKILQIKDRLKADDRQKRYVDKRRKPLEFSVGDYLAQSVTLERIIKKVGPVVYRLDLLEELNGVHDTFHVSNLKKCLVDQTLQVSLDEIHVDAKLNFTTVGSTSGEVGSSALKAKKSVGSSKKEKTSSAIPIGSEIERSANSSVMQVGVSSEIERVFQTEYGIRLMLAPRSARKDKMTAEQFSFNGVLAISLNFSLFLIKNFSIWSLAFSRRLSSFLLEGNGIDAFWLGLEALTGAFTVPLLKEKKKEKSSRSRGVLERGKNLEACIWSLIGGELDKEEVEHLGVDRFELDEPGVGVDGTSLVGLRHPPASKHNFPQNRLSTGVGAEIDFSCQGVKAFNIPLNQQLSKKIPGGDGSARNPTLATNGFVA
ncbi:putative reverse transcriptase domain-containing protein [Tanacetum coccineum]